jgi:hypothetical protein
VKTTGRAWEDAQEPVQGALAGRDFWDSSLDETAQDLRLKLSSRSLTAKNEAPYTFIFYKGIGYYTAAPVGDEKKRYRELITRSTEALDEDDELLAPTVTAIEEGLTHYERFAEELDNTRTALSMARSTRDAARDDWEKAIERIYGALIAEHGRRKAERFFPSLTSTTADDEEGVEEAPSGGGE